MTVSRDTYVEVNLANIEDNVSKIIKKYNQYKYYFGVVKADCYSHYGIKPIRAMIAGGVNYLAVSSLEEALEIRTKIKKIPILCLGIIPVDYLAICQKENITLTVNSLEYAKNLVKTPHHKLKVHIKINTGMNRLGINDKVEVTETYQILLNNKIEVEGIYTHIYNAANRKDTYQQFENFDKLITNLKDKNIPIIHIAASEGLVLYKKLDYVNGVRLGIMMYGFTTDKTLALNSTFALYSKIIQINKLKKGETVGYGAKYVAKTNQTIGVVAIGYADGIIRKNTGRYVYINDKKYKIIGNICMDMLFVKIDDNVKLYDKVTILKDLNHIKYVAKYLKTIPYEVLCNIGKRVARIYLEKD